METLLEKKETLLNVAEELANDLFSNLKNVSPNTKSPGEAELRILFNFLISEKDNTKLRILLSKKLPNRTKKTPEYWNKIREIIKPLLDDYDIEELSYLVGWSIRLLKYKNLATSKSFSKKHSYKKKNFHR